MAWLYKEYNYVHGVFIKGTSHGSHDIICGKYTPFTILVKMTIFANFKLNSWVMYIKRYRGWEENFAKFLLKRVALKTMPLG